MSKQALEMALEALNHYEKAGLATVKTIDALTAIKEALAQPEYQSTADKSKLEKVHAKGTLLAQPTE